MAHKTIYARLIMVLLLFLVLPQLTTSPTQAQEDEQLTFVIVSHGGAGNPYWKIVINGMEDACEMLQAECFWLSDPVDNVADMGNYWAEALAMNPDGIGTTVPDPEVIRESVEAAAEAGIPVISLDTDDPNRGTDLALPILFYIGGDEFLSGQKNAEDLLAHAEADGTTIARAACTIHEQGHSGLQARCNGAKEIFDADGIEMDIIDLTNDASASALVLEDYFSEHPDTNALILGGLNPVLSYGLYIEATGAEPGQVYAVTFDTDPAIFDLIQEGYVLQTIDQQPYLQGYETIIWLYLNSQYKMIPGTDVVLTGPGVIDQSNVEEIIELTLLGYR
jgi:simple sugar transport system substrate-binding protein